MKFERGIKYIFYLVGVLVFLFLVIIFAFIFGDGQSIVDFYLSWKGILFLPFYVVSLVVMEFLYNKVNKLLLGRA